MSSISCSENESIRILLVECSEDNYLVLRDALSGVSESLFQIDWVDSYERGVSEFNEGNYGVLLIGYSLGVRTGLELMRELLHSGCDSPVVIMVDQLDGNIDKEAMSLGAFDCIAIQGGAPSDLAKTIRAAFSRGQMEALLRENEKRYKTILDHIDEFVYIKDVPNAANPYGCVQYISSRVGAIIGYSEEEFYKDQNFIHRIVHPDDLREFERALVAARTDVGQTGIVSLEFRVRHKDTDQYVWVEDKAVPHTDNNGELIGYIGVVRNITARRAFEDQLKHDAMYDRLTGLPNRVLFMDRLTNAINRRKRRQDYQFAVLFVDLDRFKNINDVLGHSAGDKLLIAVSQRLCEYIRPSDTVARLGGDEFAILIEDVLHAYDATFVANRMQELLSLPIMIDNREVFSSASIGIALSVSGYSDPEEVLRDADTAMYKAKSEGRARYEVFDLEMHAQAVSALQLETDLRKALERRQFEVYYQPILRLSDGAIISFEALLRWKHPEKGMISPVDFIPVAEETGLIIPIGKWVLDEACKQMREWKIRYQGGALQHISVNLSARQFAQMDLIEYIDSVMSEHCLEPGNLHLEITESVVMENAECISAILSQFRSMGIPLSMDDFGTGYSSLSYLHRLPISTLKIDRSFIARITHNQSKSEIIETIITLAHNLGLDVVAEGLETQSQLSRLQSLGCEYGQGFLFSKPVDAAQAERLLAKVVVWQIPLPQQE